MTKLNWTEVQRIWPGWSDEDLEAHWEDQRKEQQLKIQREELRDTAWELLKRGQLSAFDYIDICRANKVLIF